MPGEVDAAMAEPLDGLRDLFAIDERDDLLAGAQRLHRQFAVGGADHRAAGVADGDDVVARYDEGRRGFRQRATLLKVNTGAPPLVLTVSTVPLKRRSVTGHEVCAINDEFVAPSHAGDGLGDGPAIREARCKLDIAGG